MMLKTALAAAVILSCVHPISSAQSAQSNSTVTIQITDPTGANIPKARMRVVPYPLELSHKLETNPDGLVKVSLAPGKYEVFVNASGFKPSSKQFEVTGTADQTVTLSLRIGEGSYVELSNQSRSADEQRVLELENTLWKYVANLDLERYAGLWQANAVAWRDDGYYLSGQKQTIEWLQRYQAGALTLEEYSVGYIEVRATGNTAVTYYSVRTLWLDDLGRGTPRQARVGHTWVKAHGKWRIFAESVF